MPRSLRDEIRQSQPFRSIQTETYLNLVRTADRLAGAEAALLKTHRLSRPQYNALRILRGAGEAGHPCRAIAERMITRVPDITRLVDRLVGRGLVERVRGDDDRRVVRVRILPEGVRLLAELDEPVEALARDQFAVLGDEVTHQLNDLLTRLRHAAEDA